MDYKEDGIWFYNMAQDNAPTNAANKVNNKDDPDSKILAIPDMSADQQEINMMRE